MRTGTGQDASAGLEGIQGTLTSWTVCLRDRSQSRESYWHLAGSVCIDAMRTATDRVLLLESYCQVQFSFVHLTKLLPGRLPGPPTYWTVCLSGWSHEILLARAGLCQEGSFLAEA